MNILFICTGNTCRSPMAEGYLRNLVERSGEKNIAVLSAGLMAMPGQPASPYSIEILKEQGIDIESHRSRNVERSFVEASTWVLTMTESHKQMLIHQFPEFTDKIKTLSEFIGESGEIQDPFGGTKEDYQKASEDIHKRVEKAWEKIKP